MALMFPSNASIASRTSSALKPASATAGTSLFGASTSASRSPSRERGADARRDHLQLGEVEEPRMAEQALGEARRERRHGHPARLHLYLKRGQDVCATRRDRRHPELRGAGDREQVVGRHGALCARRVRRAEAERAALAVAPRAEGLDQGALALRRREVDATHEEGAPLRRALIRSSASGWSADTAYSSRAHRRASHAAMCRSARGPGDQIAAARTAPSKRLASTTRRRLAVEGVAVAWAQRAWPGPRRPRGRGRRRCARGRQARRPTWSRRGAPRRCVRAAPGRRPRRSRAPGWWSRRRGSQTRRPSGGARPCSWRSQGRG